MENCSFNFNINTGLVYDWSHHNNFNYKGAISTQTNELCPYICLYTLERNLNKELKYKKETNTNDLDIELSDRSKKELLKMGASLALTSASVTIPSIIVTLPIIFAGAATAPVLVPLVVGATLLIIGYALYVYANDGNFQYALGDTLTDLVFNEVV